jgi:RNA polymerase sigma factor (TIGR02999 family)
LAGEKAGDVTLLLRRMGAGDGEAREALFALIYSELHDQAERLMRRQEKGHTLQATALVNEAYVRLASGREHEWEDRRHFFGVAGKAMRSVLMDHARRRKTAKRGGGAEPLPLDALAAKFEEQAGDLVDLDEALREFATIDARAAEVVELRFFAGLTFKEIGRMLGLSYTTVERDWELARAWLCARLR